MSDPARPSEARRLEDSDAALLAGRAVEARRWSYSPYSRYAVGAALLAASGKVYDGCNIENAAYPDSLCAERVAAVKAVSDGEREFTAIAVATENGGFPCGSCRQFLSEFGLQTLVLIVDGRGDIVRRAVLADLLPDSFGPSHLQPAETRP
jgi:cytidine deaminase